jgi:serine/threonine kinase 16
MAVTSGRYRHPPNNSGYTDKVKGLIDAMLVVEPEKRPDIDKVSVSLHR